MRIRSYAALTGALVIGAGLAIPAASTSATATKPLTAKHTQSKVGTLSTNVVKTFHSALNAGTTVKLSDDGNVVSYLSPDSGTNGHYEHIGVGEIGEGYVLCYTGATGTVNAFDTGSSESGWGPASVVLSPFRVTRSTLDGRLTLTQSYVFNGANRSLEIDMTLTNRTASPINNILLRRQVDFDVDTGGIDGWATFQNFHANTTHTSVFAFNRAADAPPGLEAHAMALEHVGPSPSVNHLAFVTHKILETSCDGSPYELGTTGAVAHGDFGDTLLYQIGRIPARGSARAQIQYARF